MIWVKVATQNRTRLFRARLELPIILGNHFPNTLTAAYLLMPTDQFITFQMKRLHRSCFHSLVGLEASNVFNNCSAEFETMSGATLEIDHSTQVPDRAIGYRVTSFILGTVLLSAGVAKLFAGSSVAMVGPFILSAPNQMVLIQFEIFLGIALLISWRPKVMRWVALAFFGSLALASTILVWQGQSECGCFGSVKIDPQATLVFDVCAVVALYVFAPPNTSAQTMGAVHREISIIHCLSLLLLWIGSAGVLMLLIGSVIAWNQGLSSAGLLSRLRGEPITLTPSSIDLGSDSEGVPKKFEILFSNYSDQDIVITGSTANCSCALGKPLPLTVPKGTSISVPAHFAFKGSPGRFNHQLTVYTDHPQRTSMSMIVSGRIVEQSQSQQSVKRK
jgi:hypothetical protein